MLPQTWRQAVGAWILSVLLLLTTKCVSFSACPIALSAERKAKNCQFDNFLYFYAWRHAI
jgi:hypothetical protein